ncbi:geminin isoform X1 [Gymnodraco acuticeps]|uniref:Geminin isoform X1 n=1 Tax=Gymnodraco acuticeps TaxID=8218 RepID=A0A6P8SU62_GYMAC|nr:geminin isoform X1 [Gymnodraco acuticeps]
MNFTGKMTNRQQKSDENVHSFFKPSLMAMGLPRQRLQVLQPLADNVGNIIPKRKLWSSEQTRGPKRVKVEVKSTQTEETQCSTDGMTSEAYDLMVVETPPSNYWKETAEERRKALQVVIQENKKMHKCIEAKEEQITQLKCENEELQALAQHVQYMADMIERLTGKSPDNLEELQDIALDVVDDDDEEEDDADSDFSHSDSVEEEPSDHDEEETSDHQEDEEETSDNEEAGPPSEQD